MWLYCYSIDCIKAGYLVKKSCVWYLTEEGEESLKLGPVELLNSAQQAYRKWCAENPRSEIVDTGDSDQPEGEDAITLDQIKQLASQSLERYIQSKNPYEFQDLDIDIFAYRDPMGTQSPRIKVQVKHRGALDSGKKM